MNLGDDIEDEGREADLARYTECQDILRTANAELVNVAGNHDTIHLDARRPRRASGETSDGPLFYSFDRGGFHLVVLHTLERKDVDVRIPHAQLEWLDGRPRADDRSPSSCSCTTRRASRTSPTPSGSTASRTSRS